MGKAARAAEAYRRDPEAARGRIMTSPQFSAALAKAVTQVNVAAPSMDVKVRGPTIKAAIDGTPLFAKVGKISSIVHDLSRATNGESGFDAREHPGYPHRVGAHWP